MATKPNAKAILPIDVRRINSFMPCESCSVKRSTFRVRFDPPGRARVEHRLCDRCIEGIKQG